MGLRLGRRFDRAAFLSISEAAASLGVSPLAIKRTMDIAIDDVRLAPEEGVEGMADAHLIRVPLGV